MRGGEVVASGTPEEVVATTTSYTGHYLKPMIKRAREATEYGLALANDCNDARIVIFRFLFLNSFKDV